MRPEKFIAQDRYYGVKELWSPSKLEIPQSDANFTAEQKLLSNAKRAHKLILIRQSIVFCRGEVEKHLWWQGVHLPCIILSLRGSGGTFKYY